MSRWVLDCPSCHEEFTHAEIKRERLEDYFLPEPKPQFPDGGLSIDCPHCHMKSLYEGRQLRFRHD